MTINPKLLDELDRERRLDAETLVSLGISTGRMQLADPEDPEGGKEVVADPAGSILVFPLTHHGKRVGEKYRAPGKRFWQKAGGMRTFVNADVLDDPQVSAGEVDVVITEGEFDMVAAIQCGFPFSMSIPDGGSAPPEGYGETELEPWDPGEDRNGKFAFIFNNRDRIKNVRRFILALDDDAVGRRMRAEMVRRLSAAKCAHVSYPEGCKDLNDVLKAHGPEAVARALTEARPYPIKGLYKLSDYPDLDNPKTYEVGLASLDAKLKFYHGAFGCVLGVPQMGKSTWVIWYAAELAYQHGLKIAVASFEAAPTPNLRSMLRHFFAGKVGKSRNDVTIWPDADEWIDRHFSWIDAELDYDGEDVSVDWVLEKAEDCLFRHGLDFLIIDPWNELDHYREHGQNDYEYTGQVIKKIKRFCRSRNVTTYVVVHPTKSVKEKDGKTSVPHPYDAAGSSHFFNKTDQFVTIHRETPLALITEVHVQKVKFAYGGKYGIAEMRYQPVTGRFEEDVDVQGSMAV